MTLAALGGLALLLVALVLTGFALARLSSSGKRYETTVSDSQQNNEQGQSQPDDELVERVNAILPQTQCAQCGYPGCRPYADAIITQNESINRCPPGGDRTIAELSELLGTPVIALDTSCGESKPAQVAVIDEAVCIGCTLCIHACPVDAIVGAGKLMHTVIRDECTGCELCVPPCPVDCIELVTPEVNTSNWQWPKPG